MFESMKETTLAERLKMAIKKNNFTQEKLASVTGVAQPTIWKLLHGKILRSRKILQIARALSVSPEWLSEGKGSMHLSDGNVNAHETVKSSLSYDNIFLVDVHGKKGATGETVLVPDSIKSKNCVAYRVDNNSGCAEIPSGTLIVVDTKETPGNRDLVYACVNDSLSVYHFMTGGTFGFLSVDDPRIPLIELTSKSSLIGVIVYFARQLRRE
ncbi:putative transcriptional regulator [Candidatus Regiella insecticola 5.15]|uniref:Putative transcriptional regulator n=1 Tax=Candidatus Regiella insecticola 5.15 TaxID=1005043 RepID=G2GZV1_9ENTR|nr:helix-turn-helix domain-containing protein [Candidatus Regiella insecticola]EGY28730.1 putative transcriptional regulator [Candidatus Regiella insecticola 5.15]